MEAIEKYQNNRQKQQELDVENIKLRQFIYATMNLLPDKERLIFQAQVANMAASLSSLKDAVCEVLKLAAQRNDYFTVVEVKEHLEKAGFDFSEYSSNPLASVNTTIKRFKDTEVQCKEINGVAAYRWILRFPRVKLPPMPERPKFK